MASHRVRLGRDEHRADPLDVARLDQAPPADEVLYVRAPLHTGLQPVQVRQDPGVHDPRAAASSRSASTRWSTSVRRSEIFTTPPVCCRWRCLSARSCTTEIGAASTRANRDSGVDLLGQQLVGPPHDPGVLLRRIRPRSAIYEAPAEAIFDVSIIAAHECVLSATP